MLAHPLRCNFWWCAALEAGATEFYTNEEDWRRFAPLCGGVVLKQINRAAAINIARDLCLKLIERRTIAPEQLSGCLAFLTVAVENLFQEIDDGDGLWLVRLARDLTLKMIERNLAASPQAVAEALAHNGAMVAAVAGSLEPKAAPAALNAARDLCLKLLETGRLNRSALPELFAELAQSVGQPRKENVE